MAIVKSKLLKQLSENYPNFLKKDLEKLIEEMDRDAALKNYGSEASGKNLPFSSLSDDLLKKKEENKE